MREVPEAGDGDESTGARARVGLLDTFGLRPLGPALRDALAALRGTEHLPPVRWGLSSTRIFKPHISLPTWLRLRPRDRRVPVYNLVNRRRRVGPEGYSVRVTDCRDFLGGAFTYDGHMGTDFALPVGTRIVAAAPGLVVRVRREFDRGGLNVCLDHGDGLFTTYHHLARTFVTPGDRLARAQPLGLSGASGLDLALFFPWVAPHLHFNVLLGGEPVDPFARMDAGERPLWRSGNEPRPFDGAPCAEDAGVEATPVDEAALEEAVAACRDDAVRERARALGSAHERAAEILCQWSFRPTFFAGAPRVHVGPARHRACLDLPIAREECDGCALPGQLPALWWARAARTDPRTG